MNLLDLYEMRDRRDAYQRDYDHSVSGMDKRDSYAYSQDGGGNDERHDLDPTDWYVVKDGKMFKVSVYPNQEQQAIALGYSRTRDEARAKAGQQGVAEATGDKPFDSMMNTIKKGTAKQKTADRRAEKAHSQQRARDAFGPNPAASLGIRKPGVAEGSENFEGVLWRVEYSEATGRFSVVKGYNQHRKTWKNKFGAGDFNQKQSAEDKAAELNKGVAEAEKKGLYYYVNKRKKAGTSRDANSPKAPTAQAWKDAAKTAKKEDLSEAAEDRISYQVAKVLHDHGIKYDPAREDELVKAIELVLVKKLDIDPRQVRGIMNDEDFLGDTFGELQHMSQSVTEIVGYTQTNPVANARKPVQKKTPNPFSKSADDKKSQLQRMKDAGKKNWYALEDIAEAEADSDGYSVDTADSGEYDYEGDQARDQINTIVRAARRLDGLLDDNENMPEWVQMKVTLAADYLDTAADYIESNQEPELAEGGLGSGRPTPGAWDTTSGQVGRVEKTAQGIRHHADPSRYGGTEPEHELDKLDKGAVNTMDKVLGVKWDRESKKYFSPVKVDEVEKVGNMDADKFDAAMSRLKQLAGAGPMKTVWDPEKRVYRNVPTAVQPRK